MTSIRDEYAPRFGRQELTLWRGPFASDMIGFATELPRHDGFMVTEYFRGFSVRVACESPRTSENFERVDAAITAAFDAAYAAHMAEIRREQEARRVARDMARLVGSAFMTGAS